MYPQNPNRARLRARLHEKILSECARFGIYKLGAAARAIVENEVTEVLQKSSATEAELKRIACKARDAHYAEHAHLKPESEKSERSAPGSRASSRPATSFSMRPGSVAAAHRSSTPQLGAAALRPGSRLGTPAKLQASLTNSPTMGPIYKKKLYERLANAEWEEKLNQDLINYQVEKGDEMRKKQEMQNMIKQSLDDQVKLLQAEKAKKDAIEEEFSQSEVQRKSKWEDEQKEQEYQRWQNRIKERENLKNQIKAREAEKRAEEDRRKQEEEDYANMIAEEHRKRKDDEKGKREREYAEIQQFLDYNSMMSDKKKRAKQEEIEQERRYLAEYAEYLEKKEQEYKDNLARITSNQQKRVNLATSTYFKSLWDHEQRDAAKAEREQNELQAKLRQDEAKRKQRILSERKNMTDMLAMQVEEKQRVKQAEVDEQRHTRETLEALLRDEELEAAKRRTAKQQERMARAKELDHQVTMLELKQRSPMEIKIGSRDDVQRPWATLPY
eukprot:TRINITY_DN21853_c0_g1_i1.p1 TRINITY_DN21853_c0_g1~~TRINITY_DN21853_c0_g1_i1.p1  ORF type:complete len:501 (-),score=71.77 TRINITY_DN21853_c0_g1_i1:112-1614(-)